MHFIFSLAFALQAAFVAHLNNCKLHFISDELVDDRISLLSYSFSKPVGMPFYGSSSEIGCSCYANNEMDHSAECSSLISSYLHYVDNEVFGHINDTLRSSCVLYDRRESSVIIFSDSVGAFPIWFALEKPGFVVTSDLVGAIRLGFTDLTAVGPGQIQILNLYSSSIIAWSTIAVLPKVSDEAKLHRHIIDHNDAKVTAYGLVTRLMDVVYDYVENVEAKDQSSGINELDLMDSNSWILDCAVQAVMPHRHSPYISLPLITGSTTRQRQQPYFPIIEGLENVNTWLSNSDVRLERFASLVEERWDVCMRAVTKAGCAAGELSCHPILMSFNNELHYDPLKMYFQNLFCAMLHVRVRFPFQDLFIHNLLKGVTHPKSFMRQAVNILQDANNVCPRARVFGTKTFNAAGDLVDDDAVTASSHMVLSPSSTKYSYMWDLWQHASDVTSRSVDIDRKRIVVLLVTIGYADMLHNFLLFATSNHVNVHNFLIITMDEEVKILGNSFNVTVLMTGTASAEKEDQKGTSSSGSHNSNSNGTAATASPISFGSISYQQLILRRTTVIMDLLLLGFNPVVVDIDTVWLQNPMSVADEDTSAAGVVDVAVTDDYGEICGCFIILKNTPHTRLFWRRVLQEHQQIVSSALLKKDRNLDKFSDSEQKILTRLILENEYKGQLNVHILSKIKFPSGFLFFNLRKENNVTMVRRDGDDRTCVIATMNSSSVAVVHNNFIVGKELKRLRFIRYGLWAIPEGGQYDGQYTQINTAHTIMPHLSRSGDVGTHGLFGDAVRNLSIPSITVVVPKHDTVVRTGRILAQINVEGFASETEYNEAELQLWVRNDPPSYVEVKHLGVFDMSLHADKEVSSFSTLVKSSNIGISVDVGVDTDVFGVDRHGVHSYMVKANQYVWNSSLHSTLRKSDCYADSSAGESSSGPSTVVSGSGIAEEDMEIAIESPLSISVLAYNRPHSLQRLLSSLLKANYMNHSNISLSVYIDYPKTEEVMMKRLEVIQIADDFIWPFGLKSVTVHADHMGLNKQWFYSWMPEKETGACFVFEDDVEVSPFFYEWGYRAFVKYYDTDQLMLHRSLLDAVREDIRIGETNGSTSSLENFAKATTGMPLLYGICLQAQHLDPHHYPKKLFIRNSRKPFLYRSALAREHGRWEPTTESLVVNYFYRENPSIWTPWITRFAYETGAKCLYSNFHVEGAATHHQLSLVTNHRDAGESYHVDGAGSSSEILQQEHVCATEECEDDGHLTSDILWNFPSISSLHQYDFNVRRAGGLGSDKLVSLEPLECTAFTSAVHDTHTHFPQHGDLSLAAVLLTYPECTMKVLNARLAVDEAYVMQCSVNLPVYLTNWVHLKAQLKSTLRTAAGDADVPTSTSTQMSPMHWMYAVEEVILGNIPTTASFLHIGLTPLFPMLMSRYWRHHYVEVLSGQGQGDAMCGEEVCLLPVPYLCAQMTAELRQCVKEEGQCSTLLHRSAEQLMSGESPVSCSSFHPASAQVDVSTVSDGSSIAHAYSVVVLDMAVFHTFFAEVTQDKSSFWAILSGLRAPHSGAADTHVGTPLLAAPPMYILVVGECLSNPTSFSFPWVRRDSSLPASVAYQLVEDLCAEKDWHQQGVSLYRHQLTHSKGPQKEWHSVTRRFQGDLISTRFVQRVRENTFV